MGNTYAGFGAGVVIALAIMGIAFAAAQGPTTGIIASHNHKPIYNMLVSVRCSYGPGSTAAGGEALLSGTTDGTGTFTWYNANVNSCSGMGYMYSFTYNGTAYAFPGPDPGVVNATV
jgi:hypothetical protein